MRTSLHLRPIRTLALVGALGVAATGCGVTADTTAATVGDHAISIDDVNALVEVPAIVGPDVQGVDESRQPGGLARTALLYEIQRVAWIEEAQRWGAEPTAEQLAQAEEQVQAQLGAAGAQLSGDTLDGAVESSAAQNALLERFARIDPTDEADLRLVYEGAPSRWRSWCLTVVATSPENAERVESLLDDDVELAEVADRVDDAQLLATPEQCFVGSELPAELEAAAREANGGTRPDPVPTNLGSGEGLLFYEVETASSSSFDEARDEVAFVAQNLRRAVDELAALAGLGADATEEQIQQAQQTQQQAIDVLLDWMSERIRSTEVNPRYGTGVVARPEQLGGGFEVTPPPAPLPPAGEMLNSPGGIVSDPTAVTGG
ncbi:MAG: SurA N-terminal domain-containing protein [Actinomycetota bacterium]|nr:SurA N-terminal domain-containing protein [Actinomycetota bacterium]